MKIQENIKFQIQAYSEDFDKWIIMEGCISEDESKWTLQEFRKKYPHARFRLAIIRETLEVIE